MSVITGKDGIVWLYGAAPGTPPVAACIRDWLLSFSVTRMPGEATLTATELRQLTYGPALRARALTREELSG